jgi:hypothetical protein
MPVTITPEQRKVLVRCKLRPATLKQYYAVRSLLALGKGEPVSRVAKTLGQPEVRVRRWCAGFEKAGVRYVLILGRKVNRPARYHELPRADDDQADDQDLRRRAEAIAPGRARLDALIDRLPPSSISYDDEDDELPC